MTSTAKSKNNSAFSYDIAFSRNLGLVSPDDQQILKNATVAITGLGGVGGVHAVTLARMGIGNFHIADFDHFELHNFNRQSGATMSTLGRSKCEVMKDMILDINPEANVVIFEEGINADNIDDYLEGVDVGIDGLDYFAVNARDIFYKKTYANNIPVVAAGPIGFSTALLIFEPGKMSWHNYFAMDLAKSEFDKYVLFALGTAPKATHLSYMDRSYVNLEEKRGPSIAASVQLCAGVTATEVIKLLTGKGKVFSAPWFHQFDAYKCKYSKGKLRWGNRGWFQQFKFWLFKRLFNPK